MAVTLAAVTLAALVTGAPGVSAQTAAQCSNIGSAPETYGPTDISAATGNQALSVGFNDEGTVTVLKWPSPSYYDQIKYTTSDRSRKRLGALPNEGAFIGVALRNRGSSKWHFSWLRQLPSPPQRFADDDTDEVVSTFFDRDDNVRINVRDVVARDTDALYRSIKVTKTKGSKVVVARVIGFANFNPVVSKDAQAPYSDWCAEENNDAGGNYNKDLDAVVHIRSGNDSSTNQQSSVALAMGFTRPSSGHEVGPDSYETGSNGLSAYDDAADGKLKGDDSANGQADAAISTDLSLARHNSATTTLLLVTAFNQKELGQSLDAARTESYAQVAHNKARWWKSWLSAAVLPKGAPGAVTKLAKRALITIRQNADDSGLIVRSISTQPPYGLDWIRDGAYINHALDLAGHPEMVKAHDERYAELQATFTTQPPGASAVPSGNWGQNYYADGVVGGAIPYEIDETGLGIWTLWDHYAQTGDKTYLLSANVYESIQRAAQYLSDVCKDPTNNLQCVASEEDRQSPSQTLVGAQAVWLGLDAAARAARVRNTPDSIANATKWETRRDEIGDAIEANFHNAQCKCYTTDYETGGTFLWPVGLVSYSSPEAAGQADKNFIHIRKALNGKDKTGRWESRALLGNAYVWTHGADHTALLKALTWIAQNATTDTTGLLGEVWSTLPPKSTHYIAREGQPQAANLAMYYLAALKAYGKTSWSD